jgi:hypothetical protein
VPAVELALEAGLQVVPDPQEGPGLQRHCIPPVDVLFVFLHDFQSIGPRRGELGDGRHVFASEGGPKSSTCANGRQLSIHCQRFESATACQLLQGCSVDVQLERFDEGPRETAATAKGQKIIRIDLPIRGENDLKGLAVLLASDASNFMTGAVIPVDDGSIAW